MRRYYSTAAAFALMTMLTVLGSAADASPPVQKVQVGVLECKGGPTIGFILGAVTGVDAMAASVVGVGGNVLLGGSNNSIALQPVSVQATTGVTVAQDWRA